MAIFVKSISRSTKGTLQSETINQVEFSPHYNSGCGFSCFLNNEVAIIEAEVLSIFVEEQREYSFLQSICFLICATIHEKILLS